MDPPLLRLVPLQQQNMLLQHRNYSIFPLLAIVIGLALPCVVML